MPLWEAARRPDPGQPLRQDVVRATRGDKLQTPPNKAHEEVFNGQVWTGRQARRPRCTCAFQCCAIIFAAALKVCAQRRTVTLTRSQDTYCSGPAPPYHPLAGIYRNNCYFIPKYLRSTRRVNQV